MSIEWKPRTDDHYIQSVCGRWRIAKVPLDGGYRYSVFDMRANQDDQYLGSFSTSAEAIVFANGAKQ